MARLSALSVPHPVREESRSQTMTSQCSCHRGTRLVELLELILCPVTPSARGQKATRPHLEGTLAPCNQQLLMPHPVPTREPLGTSVLCIALPEPSVYRLVWLDRGAPEPACKGLCIPTSQLCRAPLSSQIALARLSTEQEHSHTGLSCRPLTEMILAILLVPSRRRTSSLEQLSGI
ncbi:hypothetical protein NDU88_005994 [Pleurodeles waltl]|uniref:Uncharacterized protein n=1 Tax=Pleurodeles waltl TaxID=8319 RepID=A0AAV7N2S7_PLEWA|nr:hypothetical protein NDU88_005994 [Pleurodeles waltl]